MQFDVIVIGGGAAGLMCAIEAGRRGRRVLVIERNHEVGRKILISGGGRCNFTNRAAAPENFLSRNPDFCRSALARYTPADFVAWVEKHGIAWHEKKLGQLFCDGSARQIVSLLTGACAEAGVEIRCGLEVEGVDRPAGFALRTSRGELRADALVIATGGLSIPKLGATDFALRVARHFGVSVTPTRPGLVPLRCEGDELAFCAALAGVSIATTTSVGGQAFRENALFTHRGLSGPAVLQASSYWQPGAALEIDLFPAGDAARALADARVRGRGLVRVLEERQARRFAQGWAERYGPTQPLRELSKREFGALAAQLHAWRLVPSESEGYGKAEVTVGGVDTRELSSRTLECRRVPGLYFIGEAVDVTGWLGGFNFQWAWASGHAAGQAA
ncbi:MAG: NAD(P)/FAD-dependent oxidoreductase [Myxococcota bacterium]